jgi:two-component system alkaline phosphatase synthesis response regulator PhoP
MALDNPQYLPETVKNKVAGVAMKNILIVDDDDDLRDAIRTVLEDTYGIEEAGNKQAVYDKLATFKADLIILDVMMDTASSGFELARELKNDPAFKKIKILMLTSVDKVMKIDFKAEAGNPDWLPVDDYIQKPLEPKALIEKVASILK